MSSKEEMVDQADTVCTMVRRVDLEQGGLSFLGYNRCDNKIVFTGWTKVSTYCTRGPFASAGPSAHPATA